MSSCISEEPDEDDENNCGKPTTGRESAKGKVTGSMTTKITSTLGLPVMSIVT